MGFQRLEEVDTLTIPEYEMLMEALDYRRLDELHAQHRVAYLVFAAQAKKGKYQRPVYKKFDQFFDFEREEAKIRRKYHPDPRFTELSKHMKGGGAHGE